MSPSSKGGEFSENRRGNSGKVVSSSVPSGGFNLAGVKQSNAPASSLTTVSVVNMPPGLSGISLLLIFFSSLFFDIRCSELYVCYPYFIFY